MEYPLRVGILPIILAFLSIVESSSTRRVLVFGGNGFIGSEVVSRLIKQGDDITIVNRGNWYFDSKERIKPYTSTHYRCDRDKALHLECPELLTSGFYDIVLDFSSYTSLQIKQVLETFKERVGLYIYISSDSVYEVCDKKHKGPSREEDAVRPKSPKKRLKLKKSEEYGHEKLACEEALRAQRKAGGFPYVVLRLPDVVGPRDGSFRFWTYQLWVQTHKAIEHPVHLPQGVSNRPFSLVHVEDVANAVEKILEIGNKAYDQAINLAFEEHFTLKDLLESIGREVRVTDITWLTDEETAWHTYPTVMQGPLDINRAKTLLDWKPMAWADSLASLTKYYEEAMTSKHLREEKEMVLADFMEYHVPEEKSEVFLRALSNIYGEEVFDGINLDLGFADDSLALERRVDIGNDTTTDNKKEPKSEKTEEDAEKKDEDIRETNDGKLSDEL
ncbi:predicted protein [Nematostella vectensis]|uniref:NAD-dependent epimerase/dehydratase domain-containing protein n=1 Tax=Nematostella vectensis TaxID=45351 RepID=A7RRN1_NEMVE|nr:uncharacterized protein LOC5517925 [Nematostella vectensis]EDO45856.1 predicted protein [Nematostella vectensis]|eukprot:XP_001637919.1 predicted protein [Nematostella vectensis]